MQSFFISFNKLNKGIVYFFLLYLYPGSFLAQYAAVIHVRKEGGQFLFFQKSNASDTLQKNINDLFYFYVPDSLKEKTVFSIENGQLSETDSSHVVRLLHLPGLKYEYVFEGKAQLHPKSNIPENVSYKARINGTSMLEPKKISVRLQTRFDGSVLYERIFFIQP